jgi:hypothetical protein
MDILGGIGTIEFGFGSVASIIKLLFLVIAFGYLMYVFLLTLRIRILADTVQTPSNGSTKIASYAHLLIAIAGSALSVILILVG